MSIKLILMVSRKHPHSEISLRKNLIKKKFCIQSLAKSKPTVSSSSQDKWIFYGENTTRIYFVKRFLRCLKPRTEPNLWVSSNKCSKTENSKFSLKTTPLKNSNSKKLV